MILSKRQRQNLHSGLEDLPTVPDSVKTDANGLGEKIDDTPNIPPKSRIDNYWRNMRPNGKLLGRSALTLSTIQLERKLWLLYPFETARHFGLESIEFGNWMTQQDRANHLYALAQSLEDLATVLKIEPKEIGQNGALNIALGARGNGYSTGVAHFDPTYWVINLTKEYGKGALAHEYIHSIDAGLWLHRGLGAGPYMTQVKGAESDEAFVDPSRLTSRADPILKAAETIFQRLLINNRGDGQPSNFFNRMKNFHPYDKTRTEVFARSFEAWVRSKLEGLGIENTYLVCSRDPLYPRGEELIHIDREWSALAKLIFAQPKAAIGEKPKSGILYGDETEIQTPQKKIPARYAIVELNSLIPSNDPDTFKPSEKYPEACQQRDYSKDKSEQAKVKSNAQNLNPRFLVTDVPTATDGPPIATESRIVLGGNSRAMSLMITDKYDRYREYLSKALGLFGIDAAKFAAFKQPVLIRVVDISMKQCALYSNILNQGLTQKIDLTQSAISMARQLTDADLEQIGREFEDANVDTPAEALTKRSVVAKLIPILRRSGIITDQNVSEWIADGTFTEIGRLNIERTLLGSILTDRTLTESARNYTAHLLKVLPLLVRLHGLPEGWDLVPHIQHAIKLESERRGAGILKRDFLGQTSLVRSATEASELTLRIWDALDSGIGKWKKTLEYYISQGEEQARGGGMFETVPITPEKALSRAMDKAGIESKSALGDGGVGPKRLSDAVAINRKGVPLGSKLRDLLDRLPAGFRLMIWGKPGSGKSRLAMIAANDLGKSGKVLYVSGEDSTDSGRLQARAKSLGLRPENIDTLDPETLGVVRIARIRNALLSGKYSYCIIDSVNVVYTDKGIAKTQDFMSIASDFPGIGWVWIVQSDQDGRRFRGWADLANMATAVVKCENQTAKAVKNWDSTTALGSMSIR